VINNKATMQDAIAWVISNTVMVVIIPQKGDPIKLPNVVCCHEVDDGIM
jgi:Cu2+-containing amine oxidase